ncbi:Rrf2 family transcriptional regulator [bacterium]|nr:Rrf2 family transcriptional regulator [bacterium]
MGKIFNISEAATLALHTTVLLAEEPDEMLSIKDIVVKIPASKAHLSKVLQRLGKEGIVKSLRGPKGGFVIGKDPADITLLDVFEAIEGPLSTESCLFHEQVCNGTCILDNVLDDLNKKIYHTLKNKRLSEITGIY